MFACAMLTGCSCLRQTVEVPVYIHDTTYTAKEVHDSTYIERWHTVEVKGDTVFATDIHVESKYITRYDTVYKSVEKPVTITTTETIEIKKPLSWWQKTFIWMGVLSLVCAVVVVIWKCRKLFVK